MAAALLLFVAGMATDRLLKGGSRAVSPEAIVSAAQSDSVREVTFVLSAPAAHDVALVGDFNEWNRRRAKLVRNAANQWEIHVRLRPGLHMYAFIVDGSAWIADPLAPRGAGDDYGVASSTILVDRAVRPATAPRS
jgi:1,4-alpha-glucan branching enzyme